MSHRYLELESQVWNVDKCSGCGMCVAACSRGRLSFDPGMNHPTFVPKIKTVGLSISDVDTCSFCEGLCTESCPRLKEWDNQEIGRLYAAKTTRACAGIPLNEVIIDLLSAGLVNGYFDSVLIMDMNKQDGKPSARVVHSVEELYQISGHQAVWTPILSSLYKEILDKHIKKIAVVGPPCVAQAVKKVSDSANDGLGILRDTLGISVAIFCPGFYEASILDDLSSRLKVSPADILSIRRSAANDILQVKLASGRTEKIPVEEEQKYLRKGCARCTDFLGEMADISAGAFGSSEGYATLIAWNPIGNNFIQNCLNFGLIETNSDVNLEALEAARSVKERRARTQAFDSLLIYSLESLTDKRRLEEAKRLFMDLFGDKSQESQKSSKSCGSGCVGC
ncbi:MAG: Coenzyme F420 hydrogenase/dehydrogenase, beta subunit C-terminal domain [Candidatus Bathyarchaeota archaeon]|nr:MAG: Coenzyme F420 hydrogenase/dehydrogenase, beta subunit C-terminal domain [Candidatus Bathyarchaeota archaeon]